MNVHFTSTHINTICKLNEIAKKHNCKLYISTSSQNFIQDEALDYIFDYLRENDSELTEKLSDEIMEHFHFEDMFFTVDNVCFELLEGFKSNSLTYFEYEMGFSYMEDSYGLIYSLSNEAQEWVDDRLSDTYFYNNTDKSTIRGFNGIDTSDINVYREGIALKCFGDLVCDYLNEPRIEAVY